MLRKIASFIIGKPIPARKQIPPEQLSAHRRATRERELIHRESKIGSTVLGPIPAGHSREFFCLDKYTWVWFEQWLDEKTQEPTQMTVQYEFQPQGVLKVVNKIPRGYIEDQELDHLLEAMETYTKRVAVEVYGRAPLAA